MTLIFDFPKTELSHPVNNVADVLKALIEKDFISERCFKLNGFRSRVSNIRDLLEPEGVTVHFAIKEFINEHGRKSSYREHFLLPQEKEIAVEVYNRINVK